MKYITRIKSFCIIFLFLATGFQYANDRQAAGQQIEKAGWLLGTWENKTSRGSLFETWRKKSENEFFGKSYRVNEQDTVVFEQIQLLQNADGMFYIPTVRDQNDGRAIVFKLTSITNDRMVFENPEHDFPQVISYTMVSADSLVAETSGNRNGKLSSRSFPMKRVR